MNLETLLEAFHRKTGIIFTDKRENVKQKIIRFYSEAGYPDVNSFYNALHNDSKLYERFTNFLTTSETYFFREYAQIELFIKELLPKKGQRIKILCAPCASGEEPYSILIALQEAGFAIDLLEVYGVDINSDEIKKAKEGRYAPRRLHRLSDDQKAHYFIREDDTYLLKQEIKRHAHFRQLNIFDSWPEDLNDFDVIFSRNMLIYFDEAAKQTCERIFYNKLVNGGKLFLGHADFIRNEVGMLKKIERGISFYEKA